MPLWPFSKEGTKTLSKVCYSNWLSTRLDQIKSLRLLRNLISHGTPYPNRMFIPVSFPKLIVQLLLSSISCIAPKLQNLTLSNSTVQNKLREPTASLPRRNSLELKNRAMTFPVPLAPIEFLHNLQQSN